MDLLLYKRSFTSTVNKLLELERVVLFEIRIETSQVSLNVNFDLS